MPDRDIAADRQYRRDRLLEMTELELVALAEELSDRITELEDGERIGYITGCSKDGYWQISFDGDPFTYDEAIEDLHEAATEAPDVEWHILEVRVSDARPEVSDRG